METNDPTSSATTAQTEPAVIAAIDSGPGQPQEQNGTGRRAGGCPLSPRARLLVTASGLGLGYAIYRLTTHRHA